VGEVNDWVRLTDEKLQAWKDNLEKIKADPKAEIIN
jgi:hypothetical protein